MVHEPPREQGLQETAAGGESVHQVAAKRSSLRSPLHATAEETGAALLLSGPLVPLLKNLEVNPVFVALHRLPLPSPGHVGQEKNQRVSSTCSSHAWTHVCMHTRSHDPQGAEVQRQIRRWRRSNSTAIRAAPEDAS